MPRIRVSCAHLDVFGSLSECYLRALYAVGLPAAHAQQAALLGNSDGVALYVLHYAPGKAQVLKLLLCGLGLRYSREVNLLWCQGICLLVQPAACTRKHMFLLLSKLNGNFLRTL